MNFFLRRWRLIIGLPLAISFLTGVIYYFVPPTYTANTAFVPEGTSLGRLPTGIAGLAGQLGISLGGEPTQTAEFYASVAKSPEIMDQVLLSPYPNPHSNYNPSDSTMLLRILEVGGESLADSLHRGRKALKDLVSTRVDIQTNIVTLGVDSRYPVLAAAVANQFVRYLNEFNAKTRQSQAGQRRRFVEERMAETERDLRRAEGKIRQFYEGNRTWQQSPQLLFEHEQLQRQVQIQQEVFLTLRREYETARIQEVNDVPVITVVYPAAPPQEKSRPNLRLLILVGFVLGSVASVSAAFSLEFVESTRRRAGREYAEFRMLLQAAREKVRRLSRIAVGRKS